MYSIKYCFTDTPVARTGSTVATLEQKGRGGVLGVGMDGAKRGKGWGDLNIRDVDGVRSRSGEKVR